MRTCCQFTLCIHNEEWFCGRKSPIEVDDRGMCYDAVWPDIPFGELEACKEKTRRRLDREMESVNRMKENKYDNQSFFEQYSRMDRSVKGLEGAGEWHALRRIMPDFTGKRVLDLGCGFGWHCRYAVEQGAARVLGTDLSEKMLKEARVKNSAPSIEYRRMAMEDMDFVPDSFDVVLSSLAFHYVPDFGAVCDKVAGCLAAGGDFVFSVEHPVFTAYGSQDWHRDEGGAPVHWPVDHYFIEGRREAVFLGEQVVKYHKTMTTYINTLLHRGFRITHLVEPEPDPALLETVPAMKDELRRPMMLLIAAQKE